MTPIHSVQSVNKRMPIRRRASTLIEVLVVIVVFLIGILAIAQVFPKGFRILDWNRKATVAQTAIQDELARIKTHPDRLPDEIVPITTDSLGRYITDPTRSPLDLSTSATSVDATGTAYNGLLPIGTWQRSAAANLMRRVIGETQPIPAPGNVGTATGYFGGVIALQFGPIDYRPAEGNLTVYGNDLVRKSGLPDVSDIRDDSEYFITSSAGSDVALNLPSGETARNYRVSFSAYIQVTSGGPVTRHEFAGIGPVTIPAQVPTLGQYPLYAIAGQALLPTVTLNSIDPSTIRVQRIFEQISKGASFSLVGETQPNPYRFKLINEQLGVLLMSPDAYNQSILRSDGKRESLVARINYDVYDWRILREDFRVTSESPSIKQLALRGLRVRGADGPDGNYIGLMFGEGPAAIGFTDVSAANAQDADNFLLMDLNTGGVYYEKTVSTNINQIKIDKALGLVTFTSTVPSNPGITADLLLPDGTRRAVRLDGRAVRAFYMAKSEFSLQVLKGASYYYRADSAVGLPSNGYFSGGVGNSTSVYFSRSNQGRKVTCGQIYYLSSDDSSIHVLNGQDFAINFPRVDASGFGLPSIDIRDADPHAIGLDYSHGYAVRDVSGSSVAVRALWNPDSTSLDPVATNNLAKLEQWGRGWRRTTDETFLSRSEIIR